MTEQNQITTSHRLLGDRYLLLDEIGRGGMGVVWRAEDQVIGRLVAIKELRLPDGLATGERDVLEQRVLREARSAGRLNDPAVVTVFDVVSQAGTGYLVMELIDAPTLAAVVGERGPLPPDRVVGIARQLLSALRTAHAAGVVHRDVKPSNVMLLPDGRVKLTDFGIAQATDDPRLTTSGVLVGSPSYMAPERIKHSAADPACDLWSLGATLFFAVEGRGPFQRGTTAATMFAVLNEVPYLTRCQGPLASVIMGLLVVSPQGRLTEPRARALLDRVGPASATDGTGPTEPTPANRRGGATIALPPGPRRAPRRVLPVVAAGLLALVIAVALVAAGAVVGSRVLGDEPAVAGSSTLTYGQGGQIPVFKLNVNSCANGRPEPGRSFPSSSSISCSEPHDIEVYADDSLLSDSSFTGYSYPDEGQLERWAQSWCSIVFNSDFISGADKGSALTVTVLVPSQQSWSTPSGSAGSGSRSIYCLLQSRDGSQLTGSRITPS